MKSKDYKAPDNIVDNRIQMSIHQVPVPVSKISYGSVADKFPVILDGGKTIIFISDKRKESRIREKYEQRMSKRSLK
jgi:hypothetical protein